MWILLVAASQDSQNHHQLTPQELFQLVGASQPSPPAKDKKPQSQKPSSWLVTTGQTRTPDASSTSASPHCACASRHSHRSVGNSGQLRLERGWGPGMPLNQLAEASPSHPHLKPPPLFSLPNLAMFSNHWWQREMPKHNFVLLVALGSNAIWKQMPLSLSTSSSTSLPG